jgi:hypothetical protein
MGSRIFSGVVLAIIVFMAVQAAGMQGGSAFALAMVPLIAAAMNVMTGPVFSVSALSGILFLIVPLLPATNWFGADVVDAFHSVTQNLKASVVDPVSPAPSPATLLARRLADIEAACTSGVLAPSGCEEAKRRAIQSLSQALGIRDSTAPRPDEMIRSAL